MKHIASRHNSLVARFRAAARHEERTRLLLDGAHLMTEALASGVAIEQAVVASSALSRPDVRALVERLERSGAAVASAASAVMAAVSPVRSPSAIVALAQRPATAPARAFGASGPVVIACGVQDPGNVGAIVRVAEASGAAAVVAADGCADPFGWKALRGSMGSALRLPIVVEADVGETVALARRHGHRIVAAAPRGGQPLFDVDLGGHVAVVVGGEGSGVPPMILDAADVRLTIPMAAPVESLNTAVTAALILYEARRQRG